MMFPNACLLPAYLLCALASTGPDGGSPRSWSPVVPHGSKGAKASPGSSTSADNYLIAAIARNVIREKPSSPDDDSASREENPPIMIDDEVDAEHGVQVEESKDLAWIDQDTVKGVNSDVQSAEEIPDLKEKGVYLRQMDSRADKALIPVRMQKYVDYMWVILAKLFDEQSKKGIRINGHSGFNYMTNRLFGFIYKNAQAQGMTIKDLVIVTSLFFYSHKDLQEVVRPNLETPLGGITGIRKEDFQRLEGAKHVQIRQPASAHNAYVMLDSRNNENVVHTALKLHANMVAGSDKEVNMSSVLDLYYPDKYNGKLDVEENGISGEDLIEQAAEDPKIATDLVRMAYFYNKMAQDLVNLLSGDE